MIMQLEGRRGLGQKRISRVSRPIGLKGLGSLAGSFALSNPWVVLFGLLAGGLIASRYAPDWGSGKGAAWASHREAHSREKALHGRRKRRR